MTTLTSVTEHSRSHVWSYGRFFKHALSMLGLALADSLAFLSGYLLFRHGHQLPVFILPSPARGLNLASATDIYLIMCAVFVAVRYIFGDYGKRQLFWDGARATCSTVALISIPDVLLTALLGNSQLYLPMILSWAFLLVAIPLYRQFARRIMTSAGLWKIPTALIGGGKNACDAYEGLKDALSLGFDVRFLVSDPDAKTPEELKCLKLVPLVSPALVATELLELECAQVVVAAEDAQGPRASEIIQRMLGSNINVAIIPPLRGLPLFGLSTNYLFGKDMLLLQLRNNLARVPSRLAKLVVDFIGPIFVVTISSPLLLAIALAIKLDDGGPAFFSQMRVGRGGKEFKCYKFRTMKQNAEEILTYWKVENPFLYSEYVRSNFKLREDPRVTRVGKWLRQTSLDELPQLLNVLRGEMSLVGPRPLLSREIMEYGPGFELYQRIRPGITGLWQISGRSETKFSDRVSYDEWYILNWSLWYDFVILIQTAWIVVSGKGAF